MMNSPEEYDNYLENCGTKNRFGSRAKGLELQDGSMIVVIDTSYFLSGGIRQEELQAIVEHERIELTTDNRDAHLAATIGEFQYIFDKFGEQRLREYHANLCNLMGGLNDIRNQALSVVLKESE